MKFGKLKPYPFLHPIIRDHALRAVWTREMEETLAHHRQEAIDTEIVRNLYRLTANINTKFYINVPITKTQGISFPRLKELPFLRNSSPRINTGIVFAPYISIIVTPPIAVRA